MTSVRRRSRPDRLGRWLAIAGMAGTILYLPIAFVVGEYRPGYSHVSQGMSVLAESGAPGASAQAANFIMLGMMTIALAIGLHRGINQGKGSVVGPALIGVFGLFAGILDGIIPADPPDAPDTYIGAFHSLTAAIGFVALNTSMFILPRRLREDLEWKNLAVISRWLGASVIVLAVLYLRSRFGGIEVLEKWTGITQRVLVATVLLWLFLLALRLFRTSQPKP